MRIGYKLIDIFQEPIMKEWAADYINAGSIEKIEITENMETIQFHFSNGTVGRIDAYTPSKKAALILCPVGKSEISS